MNESKACRPKVVVVCGPTGIGKTKLSLALAREFKAGIVSADSMQIYKYMDIGTAKPDVREQSRAPHYMIDVAEPDENYDAARYALEARKAVENLTNENQLPLIVGGTGFYIRALLHGLFKSAPSSHDLREKLKREAELKGAGQIYQQLSRCDPTAAARIHPNDIYRVIRALEVYIITGSPISEYQQSHGFCEAPFDAFKIGLNIERKALYEQINRRVEKMIDKGLIEEVRGLLAMGYGPQLKSMQSLGYRHMLEVLENRLSIDKAIELMKRDTRRYAKRQLVWFRKDREITWMAPDDEDKACFCVKKFLDG